VRFSRHFGLNQSQAQLDFVDVDVTRDARLFVDPYAIEIKENEFSEACADQIRTFFDEVLIALRKNNLSRAQHLTAYLSEPRETYLGFSADLAANSNLVKILKSSKKRVVYKKDLKERYPFIKDDLAAFAQEHPDVLKKYKEFKGASGTLSDDDLDEEFDERAFAGALRATLRTIPAGMRHASRFHSFSQGLLTFLFYPDLINPIKEYEIHQGRKRIDIKFTNAAERGFFKRMGDLAETRSIVVFFECKNYNSELGNPELDQISGRFAPRRGKLGFIVCRTLADEALMVQRCRDTATDGRGYVIVLTDRKVEHLLGLIEAGERKTISSFLFEEYANLTR